MSKTAPRVKRTTEMRLAAQSLDAVIKAVRDLEVRAIDEAFKDGFRSGWEEAFRAMAQVAAEKAGRDAPENFSVPQIRFAEDDAPPRLVSVDEDEEHGPSVHDAVYSLIKQRPGLRGVELISILRKDREHVHERTVRTALYRLKKAGKIRVVDGRWYTPRNLPPDPLSLSIEEDDDAAAS